MSWEQLEALVGDNAEMAGVVKTLKESSTTMTNNYNALEKTNQGLLSDLTKFKAGNTLVKQSLGIDNLNEESLTEALSKLKGKSNDDKLVAEIDNYKNQLESQKNNFETEKGSLINEIRQLKNGSKLNEVIAGAGVIDDASARSDLAMIVQNMMSYNDKNETVFLNEDGTTKFNVNNQPFTMEDAVNEVLTKRPYLKAGDVKGGSGARESNGNANNNIKTNGSKEDLVNSIAKKYNL